LQILTSRLMCPNPFAQAITAIFIAGGSLA
jgi:hypothetical protein